MRIKFDDGNDSIGVEGWYELEENTLVVFINQTNAKAD